MSSHWVGHVTKALVSRGRRTHLTILIYHRVHAVADEMSPEEVDVGTFDWQMQCLRRYFHVLPLDSAVELLRHADLPPGAVSVTFDDGYRDNYEVALPALLRHGVCATFFVATGYLGDGIMFNDIVIESIRRTALARLDLRPLGFELRSLVDAAARRAAIRAILPKLKYRPWRERAQTALKIAEIAQVEPPSNLMMTAEQVRGMHGAGMTIGAHTVNHPILASMPEADVAREIGLSKRSLEEITGAPVTLFAYPNGTPGVDYRGEHVALVNRSGFSAAVSTAPGVASEATDVYQLPRFLPWDRAPGRFVARLVKNSFNRKVIHV